MHVILVAGQLTLSNTSVLVVGCGGLGCPLAQYVAAAGIGKELKHKGSDQLIRMEADLKYMKCHLNHIFLQAEKTLL